MGMNEMLSIKRFFRKYISSLRGAVAVAFGVAVPVVVAAVGVSVDMAQTYMVRERLHRALDSSALAAAATAGGESEVTDKVEDFFDANFPDEKIGDYSDLQVDISGSEIEVSATATVDTVFMDVLGYDYVEVSASTVVVRQVRGLEVVLVLDNTGSMNTNNNIGALKEASENFVEILFDRADDPDHIKIGMVPYSNTVNVGPYGVGLDENGSDYDDPFVQAPEDDIYEVYYDGATPYSDGQFEIPSEDLTYDIDEEGQWHGCVVEGEYPLDIDDHEGPWDMYRFDFNGATSTYFDNIYDSTPIVITYGDYYNTAYGPNFQCPSRFIVPLTSDEDYLLDAIDDMNASGNTLGNIGMVWGWRVISPEFPFTEGSEYDDDQWEKAVLMMTDGVNTINGYYSAHGRTDEHTVSAGDTNDRFAEICDAMKEEDILVYTVTFYSGVSESTKDYYRECATDETKYFDAPSQDDLVEVFEQISRELSNLHIKQ